MNFWRNGVVSLSAVLVMVIALFMIGSTILLSAALHDGLTQLKEKVDINIYFTADAQESDIQAFIKSTQTLPEVASVEYVNRDQAKEEFMKRHQDDQLLLQALDEVGDNPLLAYVNVKAHDPSQYKLICDQVSPSGDLSPAKVSIIQNTGGCSEERNQLAIERLSLVIAGFQKFGLAVIVILILIAALITFNTIRLAIYDAREEIAVMRLVGADNRYIRGPFIAEGILYGIIAGIITIVLFYPLTLWVKSSTAAFWGGINLFSYYLSNFLEMVLVILGAGIVLGAVASYLAVRRYLRM